MALGILLILVGPQLVHFQVYLVNFSSHWHYFSIGHFLLIACSLHSQWLDWNILKFYLLSDRVLYNDFHEVKTHISEDKKSWRESWNVNKVKTFHEILLSCSDRRIEICFSLLNIPGMFVSNVLFLTLTLSYFFVIIILVIIYHCHFFIVFDF